MIGGIQNSIPIKLSNVNNTGVIFDEDLLKSYIRRFFISDTHRRLAVNRQPERIRCIPDPRIWRVRRVTSLDAIRELNRDWIVADILRVRGIGRHRHRVRDLVPEHKSACASEVRSNSYCVALIVVGGTKALNEVI